MLRTEISEIIASSRIRGFKLVQGAHRPGRTERRTARHIFTLDVTLLPGTSQLRQLISTVRAGAGLPDYSPAAFSKHSIAATRVHLFTQTLVHPDAQPLVRSQVDLPSTPNRHLVDRRSTYSLICTDACYLIQGYADSPSGLVPQRPRR